MIGYEPKKISVLELIEYEMYENQIEFIAKPGRVLYV
jgi:hypothetical protein